MKLVTTMLALMMFIIGARCSVRAQNDSPAILKAAWAGDTEQIKQLISAGSQIDAKNKDGETALMIAAFRGDLDTVKILLAGGADANAKDNDGETPLIHAANNGTYKVDDRVGGATMTASGDMKEFVSAIGPGHSRLVRAAVLDYDPEKKEGTPLRELGVLSWSMSDVVVGARAKTGWVNYPDEEKYRGLVPGKTVTVAFDGLTFWLNNSGKNWVSFSASKATLDGQDVPITSGLETLESGAKRPFVILDGKYKLIMMFYNIHQWHMAVPPHHVDCMEALLAGGAKVETASSKGNTALMTAASVGAVSCVRILVAAHANASAKNANGDTALTLAEPFPGVLAAIKAAQQKPTVKPGNKNATKSGVTKHDVTQVAPAADISGTWELHLQGLTNGNIVIDDAKLELKLTQSGAVINGTSTGDLPVNGWIHGSDVTIKQKMETSDIPALYIVYTGKLIKVGALKGTVKYPGQKSVTWNATKAE